MAKFLIRIELHPPKKDYDRLYLEMDRRGFRKTIVGGSGETEHLPDGEYILESDASVEDVRDLAMEAAAMASTDYEVLATKVDSMASFGLRDRR